MCSIRSPSWFIQSFAFYLSLNSCEKIFCQTSIHFCCCPVRGFPGFLNDRVKISRNLVRSVLTTSIVFQSETAKRARFPSRMKTPAYICRLWISFHRRLGNLTYIATNVPAKQSDGKFFNRSGLMCVVKSKILVSDIREEMSRLLLSLHDMVIR